jgi:hypothetical protein
LRPWAGARGGDVAGLQRRKHDILDAVSAAPFGRLSWVQLAPPFSVYQTLPVVSSVPR